MLYFKDEKLISNEKFIYTYSGISQAKLELGIDALMLASGDLYKYFNIKSLQDKV